MEVVQRFRLIWDYKVCIISSSSFAPRSSLGFVFFFVFFTRAPSRWPALSFCSLTRESAKLSSGSLPLRVARRLQDTWSPKCQLKPRASPSQVLASWFCTALPVCHCLQKDFHTHTHTQHVWLFSVGEWSESPHLPLSGRWHHLNPKRIIESFPQALQM